MLEKELEITCARLKKRLDYYQGLLKAQVESTKIDQGGLLIIRIPGSAGHLDVEEIKKGFIEMAGHDDFHVVVCNDKTNLYSLLRNKLGWLLGSDIKKKWKSMENMDLKERAAEFNAFLDERNYE